MNFLTVVPFDLEKQMSIENNLASIAASLATIAEALKSHTTTDVRQAAAPVAVPAPVAAAPAVAIPAPVAAPVAPVAPVVEAPVQAAPTCPITDQPSLIAYVMTNYKSMGPVKGNQIQGVLAALGIANINEAKPEQYPAIHAGVEALKAQ
jgi:hypothetical protein